MNFIFFFFEREREQISWNQLQIQCLKESNIQRYSLKNYQINFRKRKPEGHTVKLNDKKISVSVF